MNKWEEDVDSGNSLLSLSEKKAEVGKSRFVVFFDIMGFKDRVSRNSHKKIFQELSKFRNHITRILSEHADPVEIYQFSDSIVLFTQDTSHQSFKNISTIASKIINEAIFLGIPLKGAIASGEITCDSSKQLFFGQALIDAYLLEENVYYYGVVAHHSVEKYALRLSGELYKNIYAPLKSGKIGHYELVWYANDTQEKTKVIQALINIRNTVSDSPRKYIDNTLEIIQS